MNTFTHHPLTLPFTHMIPILVCCDLGVHVCGFTWCGLGVRRDDIRRFPLIAPRIVQVKTPNPQQGRSARRIQQGLRSNRATSEGRHNGTVALQWKTQCFQESKGGAHRAPVPTPVCATIAVIIRCGTDRVCLLSRDALDRDSLTPVSRSVWGLGQNRPPALPPAQKKSALHRSRGRRGPVGRDGGVQRVESSRRTVSHRMLCVATDGASDLTGSLSGCHLAPQSHRM